MPQISGQVKCTSAPLVQVLAVLLSRSIALAIPVIGREPMSTYKQVAKSATRTRTVMRRSPKFRVVLTNLVLRVAPPRLSVSVWMDMKESMESV